MKTQREVNQAEADDKHQRAVKPQRKQEEFTRQVQDSVGDTLNAETRVLKVGPSEEALGRIHFF